MTVEAVPLATIQGLQARSDLNGQTCIVVKYVESRARYAVEVIRSSPHRTARRACADARVRAQVNGEKILVRHSSLVFHAPPATPAAPKIADSKLANSEAGSPDGTAATGEAAASPEAEAARTRESPPPAEEEALVPAPPNVPAWLAEALHCVCLPFGGARPLEPPRVGAAA